MTAQYASIINETTDQRAQALYMALISLKTPQECKMFLEDLCTPKEIDALSERWLLARQLNTGAPYRAISECTGASTTTIGRVARCLQQEKNQGYRKILNRTSGEKS